ncbi:MAG: S8 family serine peptidase [Candidatus Promineifilaceae bacterium]
MRKITTRHLVLSTLFLASLIVVFTVISARTQTADAAAWQAAVDPWVLETAITNGETEFMVYLTEQADLSAANSLSTKLEKGTYVYETLSETAARTQPAVTAELDALGVEYRPYWIANMIWVKGDLAVIQEMAERDDVSHLYANPVVHMEEPTPEQVDEKMEAIEWNILMVNADDVWAKGYTGQGVVIGGQDTGYDWDHPGLINQYRGWNGSTADHNYNWHDSIHVSNPTCLGNSPEPCDDVDHGTHTMGTMVGDDGGSNQTGMAPGAKWIGCRNMNQGAGTPASYSECYQWFVAPTDLNDMNPNPAMAPDVISNSWSCPPSEGCTDPNVLLTVVQNLRAAGILTAHAAANSGPGCSTVTDPATIYAESFSVGSTTSSDTISSFSSRGPVTVDGSNRLKPQISAPGSGVRSTLPGGGYGTKSGTSMATPHVAGLTALLISADPSLAGNVDELEKIIEVMAVPKTTNQDCGDIPGSQVPNNTFGYGRIDAIRHGLAVEGDVSPTFAAPGDMVTYTFSVTHAHILSATTNVVLTSTVPTGTSFVSASMPYTQNGDTIEWDFAQLDKFETQVVTMTVEVLNTAVDPISHDQFGATSDDVPAATYYGGPLMLTVLPESTMRTYIPMVRQD